MNTMTTEPATILNSQVRLIDSKHTGTTYRITISLPYAYTKPEAWLLSDDSPARWSVVYLLDGNWYGGMVTDMVRAMAWCGGTSDAIVVGIGYPEADDAQETWRECMTRRNRDFTPVQDSEREQRIGEFTNRPIQTGHAGQFHQFLKSELIPLIEREYRADPVRRMLAGHSLAGEFAMFALFEAPDLFNTFIIGSGDPGDYDRFFFRQEAMFAESHKTLPARVYLWAGELEEGEDNTTLPNTLRFANLLESRNYEGFTLVKQIFADQNHCEVT
jgi:hypothetical protein